MGYGFSITGSTYLLIASANSFGLPNDRPTIASFFLVGVD